MSAKQKYVLIGIGAFGHEIAKTLLNHQADVIVMDKSIQVVSKMKQEGFEFAVQLDTTDAMALAKFINPEDIVILAMGESFENNILTVSILKDIGVKKIYSRATNEIQSKILDKMNITETLFPEKQEGRRFALSLLYKDFKFIDEFTPDVLITEVPVPKKFLNKTVIDLNIRNKYNINIIGIKRRISLMDGTSIQKMFPVGFETISLTEDFSLVVIGNELDIQNLVDDNE